MAHKIDLDRGAMMKRVMATGVDVYMYTDTPGVYLNAFGGVASPELAKEAGYDIEKYGKEKLRRERMDQAMREIEAELNMDTIERSVHKELKGFKSINIGLGRYIVMDPEGNQLTKQPISREQSELLLEKLVPSDPEPEGEK